MGGPGGPGIPIKYKVYCSPNHTRLLNFSGAGSALSYTCSATSYCNSCCCAQHAHSDFRTGYRSLRELLGSHHCVNPHFKSQEHPKLNVSSLNMTNLLQNADALTPTCCQCEAGSVFVAT
ncbi:hypothetical protein ATANTOWER_009853 [Ataeniobius toweri]|uniref:Uncharacterized protein n=1 Tax=Ataeniobius toweri TaxID=208326 RepID=A0ABU7CDA5_9TELE|nr:hypothetical protein [Ataeniobius toweri]